ncbi:YbaB/EbfC family nucleoid-associated protein [Actinoplanes sp. TFC3]|uniref:YbaB/EbfC family nucleoid-associated protein n=1 Tax=Actinoplanes sp. TFC3 TaxID=1710355 RepID=UPI0008296AF3|nr:YbaB/EbfC family nucleoid-associated protein [Actinoplanes sp. TFC3]
MFDGDAAGEALERIDEWERSVARRAEQAQELTRRTAELFATAHSRDGLVEVTVDAEGRVKHLRLDERTRQQSAETTSRAAMETLQAASAALLAQYQEITAETVGAETEIGRMLIGGLRKRLGEPEDE